MNRNIIILLIVSAVILLANLGGGSLSSWDEAFYAEVSREVVQSNNWIDLTWGGEAWSDKPPLCIWGTAVFFKLFGVNEFSARLFSALSGIGVIILTYLFGRRIFTEKVGLISAVMLLSTYHFVWFSRMGVMDITFTFFIALAVYLFLKAEERPVNIVYAFIWFGFAFMTKGVGALLVPAILVLYVITRRQWRLIFNRYTAAGIALFLIIAGGWYFTAFTHYGDSFIRGHFLQHLIKRTTSSLDGHTGNLLTYINVVLYKGKPWGTLGLLVFPVFLYQTVKSRQIRNHIISSWVIIVLIIFTLARTKLHWYILPVYPALMISAAWAAERYLKRFTTPVVIAVSAAGLIYFGAHKDILTLDFNPRIKSFSIAVNKSLKEGQSLYLYDIQDPGMKFYFGEKGVHISSNEGLGKLITKKGAIIVVRNDKAAEIKGNVIAVGNNSEYTAIRLL